MYFWQMTIWYLTQEEVKLGMGNSAPLDLSPLSLSFFRVLASPPLFAAGQPCHSLLSQPRLAALPWPSPRSLVPAELVCVL